MRPRAFVPSRPFLWCAIAAAATAGIFRGADATLPQLAKADAKQTIMVQLAVDADRRREDLKALSRYDVLGVDLPTKRAALHVSRAELREIVAAGFQISFPSQDSELAKLADETPIAVNAGVASYLTPAQIVEFVKQTERDHPGIARTFEVGKTTRGRPIMGIELSSDPDAGDRPVILFNGMHHARELMTVEIMVDLIEQLATGYGNDPEITGWLDRYRIVVVPQVNPDGNQIVHNGTRMWRKNAAGDSSGTFGVDLNRNYPLTWNTCNGSSGTRSSDTYRGPSAGSEPETKAMMALFGRVRPVANISYHTFSEMILYPYGCPNDPNPQLDVYKDMAAKIRAEVIDDYGRKNTYAVGTAPDLLYPTDGDDDGWHYKQWNTISLTIEANNTTQGFQPDYGQWRDVTVERQRGGWKAMLRRVSGAGFHGMVRSSGSLDDISYQVFKKSSAAKDAVAAWQLFAAAGTAPNRVRNGSGLVYQLATPGSYEIRFSRGSTLVKTVPVTVSGTQNTDLGTLSLD